MTVDNEHRRKRLLYRANHRAIKEMDILLGGFVSRHIDGMAEAELDELEALMEENDRDLLVWFTGEMPCPDHVAGPLFDSILQFGEQRLRS